jgi:trans-aconitate methyltransferase
MGYFDTEESVQEYMEMAEGFNGAELIQTLAGFLQKGSTVLELGMGPGKDLDILKSSYTATGSDNSQIFLDRYRKDHPDADLLFLDATSLTIERKFDCIYSNKVLHQLTREQLRETFHQQKQILNPGGLIAHSFWYGTEPEEYHGIFVNNVTEEELTAIVQNDYDILRLERYTEMEEDDSIFIILRKME